MNQFPMTLSLWSLLCICFLLVVLSLWERRVRRSRFSRRKRTSSRATSRFATVRSRQAMCVNPLEDLFLRTFQQQCELPLVPQFQIMRYRVDFAHLATKTAIELDGYEAHSSPQHITNDRRRQREIEALGWHFVRFGASEVFENPTACVREVERAIRRRMTMNTW